MKYSVVIVAAGKGERLDLGYNKLLYKIDEETIIEKTVSVFRQDKDCEAIILVIASSEKAVFRKIFASDKIIFVEGGKSRQESVYYGLQAVQSVYVMIHDGARPYVSQKELDELKQVLEHEACMLAVPAIDTIKYVEDGYVKTTPLRSNCYLAQTPQCFKTKAILACHEQARKALVEASDDAQLMELFGTDPVKIVVGSYQNSKITTKADLK